MSRTFAYTRVSTTDQHTDNQVHQLKQHVPDLQDSRIVREVISGGVCAMERPEFNKLAHLQLEAGDRLVVLKLDRLGRDMMDVTNTIKFLGERGVSVLSLDLGEIDLNSPSGKLHLHVMLAVAEFEKGRLRERTVEGLQRVKAEGKVLGRPKPIERIRAVKCLRSEGVSITDVAKQLGISVATVKRLQKA